MDYFLDEFQLESHIQKEKKMKSEANSAAADPTKDISYETMIFGLLTKEKRGHNSSFL